MMKGGLGLPALAVCADLVSAECRRGMWYAREVKALALDDNDDITLALLEVEDETRLYASSAFATFASSGAQEQLCADLALVVRRLNHYPNLPQRN